MGEQNKLQLLKSLKLFSRIPDDQLENLSQFLTTVDYADGAEVFAEGSPGDSLYFISQGHVRIAKKLRSQEDSAPSYKELAVLGPGDCFGEMVLIDAVTRSADALAAGEVTLCRLGRDELNRWLESHPVLAMGFFAQIVQVLSGRLRRSSNELTLLLDLSQLLLEPFPNAKVLIQKVMERLFPYLEGDWCAGAFVYNEFNDEMELIHVSGEFQSAGEAAQSPASPAGSAWVDDSTYQVVFPGKRRSMGYIVFHRAAPLDPEDRHELSRTLTTIARLTTAALENIAYRTEDDLRSRLRKNLQAGAY